MRGSYIIRCQQDERGENKFFYNVHDFIKRKITIYSTLITKCPGTISRLWLQLRDIRVMGTHIKH